MAAQQRWWGEEEGLADFQFLRSDEADKAKAGDPAVRAARRFYDSLIKDVALVDLSLVGDGRIGLRWRIEEEVLEFKGDRVCASLACSSRGPLLAYELPFRSKDSEDALVKVRVCQDCARSLVRAYPKRR